ncbi:MAG: DUF1707 SHOCT-like domain-containing protein [Acidimicrobiales bacterium]
MRISETERRRVIEELRRHCTAGRLDMDEFGARVEEAVAAESLADLDRARRDLPFLRTEVPGAHDRGVTGSEALGWLGRERLRATAVVLLTALVVAAGVVVAVVAQWAWIALLVGGYLVGVATGRVSRFRR